MTAKGGEGLASKRSSESTLYEKRLGLYVLMGSVLYILAVRNRHESGWLGAPYSWLLVLFRAGPLGGMILMIPYMISNLRAQIESLCETLKLFHARYQRKDSLEIALELFPNLDKQFKVMQQMRGEMVQGLFYCCIGESLSEISIHYANQLGIFSQLVPFSASLLRSLGTYSFCRSLLCDSKPIKSLVHALGATSACISVALVYALGAYAMGNESSPGGVRRTLGQSVVGAGLAEQITLLSILIHLELLIQTVLFSLSIIHKRSSVYASRASRISPIVGSLLMTLSLVLRCLHLETMMVPYYIPYLEIGPYVWGLFVFIHSLAFYIRYEQEEGGQGVDRVGSGGDSFSGHDGGRAADFDSQGLRRRGGYSR